MADFEITQDDTSPALEATLEDAMGNPVDLNDSTVALNMTAQRGSSTPVIDGAPVFILDPPEAGNVRYSWQANDTHVDGGFDGRWLVTYQDGSKESFPNDGPFTIAIHAKANPQAGVGLLASTQAFAEARGVRHDPADLKARRALEDASALFRSLAHQTISLVEDDVVELRGNYTTRLWLPERPVIAVSDVSIAYGLAAWTPVTILDSSLLSTRRGLLTTWSGYAWGGPDATVRLTYTHGYAEIPDDVVAAVITLAARRLQNIVAANSQTIAAYSVDFGGLSSDEQAVILKYRPVEG